MDTLETRYEEQLIGKQKKLTELITPFANEISIVKSIPEGYRMRAEFRIWHDGVDTYHIMFDKETKTRYRVDALPAACDIINNAMQSVIKFIKRYENLRNKLFQIDYLASTTGQLVISLIYHKPLENKWEKDAEAMRQALSTIGQISIIGRAKKQKLVLGNEYVVEMLTIDSQEYVFKQIENSFTQPNAYINVKMIEWTLDNISQNNGDLLELYCGAGNFSVPLSKRFNRVLGTEISKTSVNAAQYNIAENRITNLTIARLSSEEFTEAYEQTREFYRLKDIPLSDYHFTTVLVDPPRAGLDAETLKLISKFDTIIYVSCNPITLADNLRTLSLTHRVAKAALFDQFPFTEHIESGVILQRLSN